MKFTSKSAEFSLSEGVTVEVGEIDVVKSLVQANGINPGWIFVGDEPRDIMYEFNKENCTIEVYYDTSCCSRPDWELRRTDKIDEETIQCIKAFIDFIRICYPGIRIKSSIIEAFKEES